MSQPCDAVLVISFGGPGGLEAIRPFLANVLRGRRISPERVEEVAHHYELFGGVSPITELTFQQARGLEQRLSSEGLPLPVYVGMRNWHPYLADTLAEMSRSGVRRAIGFIAAAHGSYSSCTQYKENVRDARIELGRRGLADVEVTYVDPWFDHPGFIEANAANIREALARLDPAVQAAARIIFTAHSIPLAQARSCQYQQQLERSCRLVMEELVRGADPIPGSVQHPGTAARATDALRPCSGLANRSPSPRGSSAWSLVWQSRSGRPGDPWLEPDINDYLRAERAAGLEAAVIAPIGFLCDHIEVLYDLDQEASATCREVGLPMARAAAVNDHPAFIGAMAGLVRRSWERFSRYPPLPIRGTGSL